MQETKVIVELKIEETKAVVGGLKATRAPIAFNILPRKKASAQ
jgi:hypothetical protein